MSDTARWRPKCRQALWENDLNNIFSGRRLEELQAHLTWDCARFWNAEEEKKRISQFNELVPEQDLRSRRCRDGEEMNLTVGRTESIA